MTIKTILGLLKHYLNTRLDELDKQIFICNQIDADNYSEVGKTKEIEKVIKIVNQLEQIIV